MTHFYIGEQYKLPKHLSPDLLLLEVACFWDTMTITVAPGELLFPAKTLL